VPLKTTEHSQTRVRHLVKLVMKKYPKSAMPASELRTERPEIAMSYWTRNCDDVY
jgi:hypothetical protein